MRSSEAAVYYAINDNPIYLFMARRSIETLRRYNRVINVYIFVFGRCPDTYLEFFQSYGVDITERPSIASSPPTFLKYFALEYLDHPCLLFVDADTLFFEDVEILFRECPNRDFYAREEIGTRREETEYRLGECIVRPQIDHNALDDLRQICGSNQNPIFNTGVMILNNSFHKRLLTLLSWMTTLREKFVSDELDYPCSNLHICDEVVLSIALGKIPDVKLQIMRPELSPWYIELEAKQITHPGVVLHVWTAHYLRYLSHAMEQHQLLEFQAAALLARQRGY